MSRRTQQSGLIRRTPQGTLTTFEEGASGALLLFYGGPFSQWVGDDMRIDGLVYNCPEQYMMAQKALRFGDVEAYEAIMQAQSPSAQKAIGRTVRDFDPAAWAIISRDVVRTASLFKFSQPEFRAHLLATGSATIVEASPTDVVWGIGLGEHDPACRRKSAWRGTNWLGQVLMEVRDLIR